MKVWPGESYPLGATFDGTGTNFALFSEVAEKVELCLFETDGRETRLELPEFTGFVWHGYLPNVRPGQRYGYRVHGPYEPESGHRCNPAKLLLDPYARAIDGEVQWDQAVYAYEWENPEGPLNTDDSAPFMPKCVVTSPFFDWRDDPRPRTFNS